MSDDRGATFRLRRVTEEWLTCACGAAEYLHAGGGHLICATCGARFEDEGALEAIMRRTWIEAR